MTPRLTKERYASNAATTARRVDGLETAQVFLGHSTGDVTQLYAERDMERAAKSWDPGRPWLRGLLMRGRTVNGDQSAR